MNLRCVPWSTYKEFQLVKENLLSDDYEKRRIGLDLISAWRARASVLPAGAETSSYLVAALDMDVAEYGDLAKMSVATAIVRFINLVTHLGQTGPYHQVLADVATSMNVPDWIVGLRHDITHGHMPSLESLIAGAKEAMIWLKSNYWEIEETRVRDWVFVKEFSKKRKRKKQSERTWKNFKAFYDLHESIDLYFFLIELIQAKIKNFSYLADKSLQSKVFETIKSKQIPVEDPNSVTHLSQSVLEYIIDELNVLCDTHGTEPPGFVLTQLLTEGDYLTSGASRKKDTAVSLMPKYQSLFEKLAELDSIPYLMTEFVKDVCENSSKNGASYFLQIGRCLMGSGPCELSLVSDFDWIRLAEDLMESPNEYSAACLEMIFKLKEIPKVSSSRKLALALLDYKLKGSASQLFLEKKPNRTNGVAMSTIQGLVSMERKADNETGGFSGSDDDLPDLKHLKRLQGNVLLDSVSYPIGWNRDYQSFLLTEHTWKWSRESGNL
ncbi:uncharacterized protein LOC136039593 isoform X2 [Artemia franciscana]